MTTTSRDPGQVSQMTEDNIHPPTGNTVVGPSVSGSNDHPSDTKIRQIIKQVQSYKLLASKVPALLEPQADDPLNMTPKDYRSSAAYLAATDMPTYNLLDIANFAINPTSGELGRKLIEARSNLSPSVLVWSMDSSDVVKERVALAVDVEQHEIDRLQSKLEELSMNGADPSELLTTKLKLKKLQLASKQRELREQVLAHSDMFSRYDSHSDTTTYKRNRKQSMREPRMIEKAVKEHRAHAKHAQTRKSNDEFLRKLNNAVAKIINDGKANQQKLSRVAKVVVQYHSNAEKEEQKRQERLAKERIKALRADDEAAYLRLIDQEKDTRLTHLLKQTDEFLDNLTAKVEAQQMDMSIDSVGARDQESIVAEEDKRDYYQTAHKVKEDVIEQPNILAGGKLKEYQMKGLHWLVSLYNNHLNGILADEMGLGKTIQAISLISYLMEKKGQTGPFLIIVPLSTITNWVNEFEKWAPSIIKIEYKGSQAQRKAVQLTVKQGKFNVLITTYEYVIKDRPFLCKFKWLYMIIDEGHRVKNSESKLVTTLTQYYHSRFRLILTGTPLQNNLPELWALLNFTLPRIFNSSKTFEEWFNAPFANTGEKVELNEEETLLIIRRLHKVLRPFLLRRMKKDVEAELPDKIERVIKCPMSALQNRLYQLVKAKNAADPNGRFVGMRRLNNTIMQLRKICNHPFVFEEVEDQVNPARTSNDLLWRVAGKFELLSRMLPKLSATGHRVLIFFQMTQVMTIMEDFLNHALGLQYLRLDGSTKAEDRSDLLKKFNAPNSPYFAFLLSTRAGGLGLNLQSADTVIIFDSDWNPHQDLQAQDRAHRIGQTKEVRIFRLVTNDSVEEYILERAQFKLSLDGKVIQAGKFDHKSTNEEREAMLRALLDTEHDRDGQESEVYDDEELNEIVARNEDEMAIFRKIDTERNQEWAGRSRLIEERELPKLYLSDQNNAEAEDVSSRASSTLPESRRRRQVNYDETQSDRQWLKQLEQDHDTENEEEESEEGTKRVKRLKLLLTTSNESKDAALEGRLLLIYERLERNRDDSGRTRSDIFLELPDAKLYPDYYKIISKPMSMAEIMSKIQGNQYRSVDDMVADFDQMYENAMYYNQEGSIVWEDAAHLKEYLHELVAELDSGHDEDESMGVEGSDNESSQSDAMSDIEVDSDHYVDV